MSIGGKAIGHCTSHSVSLSTETKDRAVKPAASTAYSRSPALFKDKSVMGLAVSINGEGLTFYYETEGTYAQMLAAWKSGQPIAVKCFERDNDSSPYLSGNFIITSLEATYPAQDDGTYSITLENAGSVDIDITKLSYVPAAGS